MPRPIRPATAKPIGTGAGRGIRTHLDRDDRLTLIYRDPRWRRLRTVLLTAWPQCCRCGGKATVADHIQSAQQNLDRAFDVRSVQGLCAPCNRWKTTTFDAQGAATYGMPSPAAADFRSITMREWAEHFVASGEQARVIGSPIASTSRAQRQRRWEGDISC